MSASYHPPGTPSPNPVKLSRWSKFQQDYPRLSFLVECIIALCSLMSILFILIEILIVAK